MMNMVILCRNFLIWSESDHFNSMEDFVTRNDPICGTVTLLVNNVCN